MGDDMSQGFMSVKTTRRPGAVAGVSLSKRRTWFDESELPLGDGDEIPEWMKDPVKAKAEIKRVRGEAADKRTKLTAVEQELADLKKKPADPPAKPPEKPDKPDDKKPPAPDPAVAELKTQLETLQQNLQTEKLNSLRLKVAAEAELPAELAARLQGTTEAELKADAEKLKPFKPKKDDPAPEQKMFGRQTTAIPGGAPANETDAQRRVRLGLS